MVSQRKTKDLNGSLGSPFPQILKYHIQCPEVEVILTCCKKTEASKEGLRGK